MKISSKGQITIPARHAEDAWVATPVNTNKVITAQFTKRPRLTPQLCGNEANGEEFKEIIGGALRELEPGD